jgi:hypothetical protein
LLLAGAVTVPALSCSKRPADRNGMIAPGG